MGNKAEETGVKTFVAFVLSVSPGSRFEWVCRKIVKPAKSNKCRPGAWVGIFCAIVAATSAVADEKTGIEAPQIFNNRGDLVGLYGGLVPVTNVQGETVNAIAVITRTGFVLPMTPQGDIGLFRSAYFADENCNGDEFLSPVADRWGSAPLAGLIYRSLATAEIRYIPQYSVAVTIDIKSHMSFDDQNILKCEAFDNVIAVLRSDENEPAITGYKQTQTEHAAIALRIPESPRRQAQGLGQKLAERAALETAMLEAEENLPEQQECSPGCLWEDAGNNVCEISCYVEACYFDSGDCRNESAELLERELAQMCSPGCFLDDLEDSFCDQACNNSACEFDRGDCD